MYQNEKGIFYFHYHFIIKTLKRKIFVVCCGSDRLA